MRPFLCLAFFALAAGQALPPPAPPLPPPPNWLVCAYGGVVLLNTSTGAGCSVCAILRHLPVVLWGKEAFSPVCVPSVCGQDYTTSSSDDYWVVCEPTPEPPPAPERLNVGTDVLYGGLALFVTFLLLALCLAPWWCP
jgi:hypothetical protein